MVSSRSALRFFGVASLLVGMLGALPACKVRYRHEVEKPGTEPRYTYSAGGFMRYDGYDDVAGDLEIASRDYEKPGSNVRLRLVGVIHIGDLEYYRALQKATLDTADVVLFEGVKFEGGAEEAAPDLSGLYGAIGSLLGIGFQKDGIDYRAENFVHCDVTVREGDPLFQTVDPGAVEQASALIQPLVGAKAMFTAGQDPRRVEDALKHAMVTAMAMQMSGLDDSEAAERAAERLGAGGGDQDPLRQRAEKAIDALKRLGPAMPEMPAAMKREVLERRNQYVLEQLEERLKTEEHAGDGRGRTVAIFYGAAHMPGMESVIRSWGYRPVETTWFKAWRMNGAAEPVLSERVAGGRAPAAQPHGAKPGEKHPARRPRREPVLY